MSDKEREVFTGTVIWFQHSYGFISWNKNNIPQPDLFVHYSDIAIEGFRTLKKGEQVSFELGLNHRQQPKATNVQLIK